MLCWFGHSFTRSRVSLIESKILMTGKLIQFSEKQLEVIDSPVSGHLFLEGPAGCGKTSTAVERMNHLVHLGIPPQSILVLVPQRSLLSPYQAVLQASDFPAGGDASMLTLGGLGQRMISLFWPMLGTNSGFKNPTHAPQFLTLETAQYYLAQIVTPFLQKGYFESITIDPNRIFSQILDNLNKAAVVGFSPDEIASQLRSAWSGNAKQAVVYDQVQECALRFREFCLSHNLLDYSLQFEIFAKYLWPSTLCQAHLKNTYRHLIYDNLEEDVPVAHDILSSWLPDFESALLVQDSGSGFRTFMGADRVSANSISNLCSQSLTFTESFVQSQPLQTFEKHLSYAIKEHQTLKVENIDLNEAFSVQPFRFYPQALDWITTEVDRLIRVEKVSPDQIVLLTPFLSDSLRFSISERFSACGIPFSTFRPSRSLLDEPVVKALLTYAKLTHPQWGFKPTRHDLRYALLQTIPEADLIRADLVSQILFSPNREGLKLGSFTQILPEMQQRITFTVGNKVDQIKEWLEDSATHKDEELDIFFSRLFGEILSQPAFAFHQNFEAASVTSRLIESCRKFRAAISSAALPEGMVIGKEYIQMIEQGVISAQYLSNWENPNDSNSVLIAPAFTFLMSNRPAAYQFWLDVGSSGWWARLDQPLTQPYILSRNWEQNQKWTNRNEMEVNQETLLRVTSGLLRRCSSKVHLISVGVNESGNEERGALLVAIQTVLRGLTPLERDAHV